MRSRFLKAEGNLDVDEFIAKVELIQMGSSQIKRGRCNLTTIAIEFFVPTTFDSRSSPFRRSLHTCICLDKYPRSVGVAAIEMQFSLHVLRMIYYVDAAL